MWYSLASWSRVPLSKWWWYFWLTINLLSFSHFFVLFCDWSQVNYLSFNPFNEWILATASSDTTVGLFDMRKISVPLHVLSSHTYAILPSLLLFSILLYWCPFHIHLNHMPPFILWWLTELVSVYFVFHIIYVPFLRRQGKTNILEKMCYIICNIQYTIQVMTILCRIV